LIIKQIKELLHGTKQSPPTKKVKNKHLKQINVAFPKKGIRKITVGGTQYGYHVTGNDDWIGFSIGLLEENGEILTGSFSYHSNSITNFQKDGKVKSWSGYQRVKITPDTIRQVIIYALQNGWDPGKNKGQKELGNMDDKIDLNLKEATAFPKLIHHQVALRYTQKYTGHLLKSDKALYLGEGDMYQVFHSMHEAKEFARIAVQEDLEIECWIMTARDKAVFYINSVEERALT
jgi:hypothetical protein